MSADRILWTDDKYDRQYASDGVSRFGAYVQQRAHMFASDLDSLTPVDFASTVWAIACSPVMSPGYVCTRRDVWAVTCFSGEEGRVLIADVEVRLPWPAGLRGTGPAIGWTSWARSKGTWDDPPLFIEPEDQAHALLVNAHLRVPIEMDHLPAPCKPGALDVMVAKRAVAVVAGQVNAHVGPLLAELTDSDTAGVR